MVALDLTTARAAVATILVDTCTVTLDAPGADDDTLDQTTGVLTPPDPDTTTLYTGACLVRPADNVPRVVSEGGVAITATLYEAVLPYSADVIPPGAVLTLTASSWDAALVDRSFRVRETVVSSVNLRRRLLLEART